MKDTFLMIDGNSLLHRAFHALPLMDAGGVYTNAIYGFLTMMLKAISDENARYLAVCFDEHAPTFRHTAYPDYKAGRAATPASGGWSWPGGRRTTCSARCPNWVRTPGSAPSF